MKEKGITLIALVVTIIILLILAGVTLNIALSDGGLFNKTQEAAEKYKQAQSDEQEMVRQIATQMYSDYIGVEVTGYNPTGTTTCTIETTKSGYTDSQTFERDTDMRWRIWDFDGNTLRIIGDPTNQELYLQGATGYNNGVWILDNICSTLYSNGKSKVRNLKRSDIQKVSTYNYKESKHLKNSSNYDVGNEDKSNTIQFGESVEIENAYCPNMWEKNDKNWKYEYNDDGSIIDEDYECLKWEETGTDEGNNQEGGEGKSGITKFRQSAYSHNYDKNEFIDSSYFDLIFSETERHF